MIGSNENGKPDDVSSKADLTLERLQPRLEEIWRRSGTDEAKRHEFESRLQDHWRQLFRLLYGLYGSRYDFFYHVEQVLCTAAAAWDERPGELCEQDRHRTNEPDWFQSEKIVGGALYVDLFSENLSMAREHVQYLTSMSLATYGSVRGTA